jgi:hypothetical protein
VLLILGGFLRDLKLCKKDVHSLPVKYVIVVLFVLSESEGFWLGCALKQES